MQTFTRAAHFFFFTGGLPRFDSMQLYYHELRILLYGVLYVGLARSRSSSVFQYTVLFTGVPYVAYRYSCEAVWCTVRTRTVSAATCTAVRVP